MHPGGGRHAGAALVVPGVALGADDDLKQRIETLEQKLEAIELEAGAEERADSKWHLAGYADVGFESSNQDDTDDKFSVGHFNPVFHWLYKDNLLFEAELQIELEDDGTTSVAMEYVDLNYFVNDSLTLVAGQFLSPVGQFQERLHPTWINKLPNAPAGFGHGGVQPLSDVGVQARGGVPLGGAIFGYALAVGNGPQGGHHGPELEGFNADNNSNKALSGRFGIFLPASQLEFGVSFLSAEVPGEEADAGAVTDGDLDLWGVDAAYTRAPWEFRAEYLDSSLSEHLGRAAHGDPSTSTLPETNWEAWYVQGARQFGKWEPVLRYSDYSADGYGPWTEETRSEGTVGLNYLLAPSAILKTAYQSVSPDEGEDYEQFLVQFAYGF